MIHFLRILAAMSSFLFALFGAAFGINLDEGAEGQSLHPVLRAVLGLLLIAISASIIFYLVGILSGNFPVPF